MAKVSLKVDGGGGGKKPESPPARIPLPDYKDPESRLRYAQAFTQKYGPLMSGRGDTPLRINEVPAWGKGTSKQLALQAASKLGIDPAIFYASAMEEGQSGLYPSKRGMIESWSGDKEYPVSGFINYGLDTFSDAYPGLVKKGYLPSDFINNFKASQEVNEKDERVNSANFKTPDAALQAKAAMIKDADDAVGEVAARNKIQLSPKARQFFSLIGYNAGLGNAEKMMREYSKSGYLNNDMFLEKRPSQGWSQPYENVIRRIKMANALRSEGYFDDEQPQQATKKVVLQVGK